MNPTTLSVQTFSKALSSCGWQAGQRLLAAVSGGIDSCVMVHLLAQTTIEFEIAHVNYNLRGNESKEDAAFVKQLAQNYGVAFHLYECAPDELTGNIQSAARKIRYAFFEQVANANNCTFILTAHQFDDSIETLLLNLARGCGLSGTSGIEAKQGRVLRPLLTFNRNHIAEYAQQQQLTWRNDSSNDTDKYTRNKLRHHLLPNLLAVHPQGDEGFRHTLEQLRGAQRLLLSLIKEFKHQHTHNEGNRLHINCNALQQSAAPETVLHEVLRPFEFPTWVTQQAIQLLNAQTGARVVTPTHTIIRSRQELVIEPNKKELLPPVYLALGDQLKHLQQETIALPVIFPDSNWEVIVDADKLQWPLELRNWAPGDHLQPLGMRGRKNISDILTDIKWPSHKRPEVLVLVCNNEIVWMPGYRIAAKFAISPTTTQAIRFTFDEYYYG